MLVKNRLTIELYSLFAMGIVLAGGGSAQAGQVEAAASNLSHAYNDYYSALKQNPNRNAVDTQKIANQTLASANAQIQNAIRNDTAQAYKNMGVTVTRSNSGRRGAASSTLGTGQAASTNPDAPALGGAPDNSIEPGLENATVVRAGANHRKAAGLREPADLTLDGSKIPAEIKFGQKPAQK